MAQTAARVIKVSRALSFIHLAIHPFMLQPATAASGFPSRCCTRHGSYTHILLQQKQNRNTYSVTRLKTADEERNRYILFTSSESIFLEPPLAVNSEMAAHSRCYTATYFFPQQSS
uniref:Putative secreted protein n=1 Tax=Ixodes ricinus TaxID=34613 RepID=A0A6B0UL42_IXORI